MVSYIGRVAALLGVAATFAVAAPAQAHHIPTCPGFNDPQCNVNYFTAHQVQPHVDYALWTAGWVAETVTRPVIEQVEYAKYSIEFLYDYCLTTGAAGVQKCVDEAVRNNYDTVYEIVYWNLLQPYVNPILDPVMADVEEVREDVQDQIDWVACEYFGACS